jgi:hypothetical protein
MTTDSNYITFDPNIIHFTFGKTNLKTFLNTFTTFIDNIQDNINNENDHNWKHIWTKWKQKSIIKATSRCKLANIILGTTYDYHESVASTQYQVIQAIKDNIPFTNHIIKFDKNKDNNKMWTVQFADDESTKNYFGYIDNMTNEPIIKKDLNQEENKSHNSSNDQLWTEIVRNKSGKSKVMKITASTNNKDEKEEGNTSSNQFQ